MKPVLHFNCTVTDTRFVNGEWMISFRNKAGLMCHRSADYLIVASGLYTTPKAPANFVQHAPSRTPDSTEEASSKIMHSSEVGPLRLCGKRVYIIGNGPTGCDMAVEMWRHKANMCIVIGPIVGYTGDTCGTCRPGFLNRLYDGASTFQLRVHCCNFTHLLRYRTDA